MGDKQEKVIGIEAGTSAKEIPPAKVQQAKEEILILDCVEDDDVREALEGLHAREDRTTTSEA